MRVVGADLSLTSTGLVLIEGGEPQGWFNYKTKGKRTDGYPEFCARIEEVSSEALRWLNRCDGIEGLDLLVIESPSHGSKFGNPHERAGLWWDVYRWAFRLGIPIATVAPTTRAKYIAGDGRAGKELVLEQAREHWVSEDGFTIPNDDVADACGLASMGSRWLGEPVEDMPEKNLEAMGGAKWPST